MSPSLYLINNSLLLFLDYYMRINIGICHCVKFDKTIIFRIVERMKWIVITTFRLLPQVITI
jgi:hypothetical protein